MNTEIVVEHFCFLLSFHSFAIFWFSFSISFFFLLWFAIPRSKNWQVENEKWKNKKEQGGKKFFFGVFCLFACEMFFPQFFSRFLFCFVSLFPLFKCAYRVCMTSFFHWNSNISFSFHTFLVECYLSKKKKMNEKRNFNRKKIRNICVSNDSDFKYSSLSLTMGRMNVKKTEERKVFICWNYGE